MLRKMRQTLCYFHFRALGYTADKRKSPACARIWHFQVVMRQNLFNAEFKVKITTKFPS